MSKWAEMHVPCPCGNSTDAYSVDVEGHGKCFSCGKFFPANNNNKEYDLDETNFTFEYIARRGISKETHEFCGVKAKIDATGKPVAVGYVYPNGATKIRLLDKKEFFSKGPMSEARGWLSDRFTPGSAKAITIVEGEDDAMSVLEIMGKYPVYSVRSSSSAVTDCRADYDYLNSFDKIYLALDNDAPGEKATQEIASIFGFNKIYHVRLAPFKDANDFLVNGKGAAFKSAWFNAKRFMPEGIASTWDDLDAILDNASKEPGHPWPFSGLTDTTGGLKRGRSYLISGLEGIGKTEVLHATLAHLCETDPEANIGVLLWEEPPDDTLKKQAGYYLKQPCHTDDSLVSDAEVKAAYKAAFQRPDRVHVVAHFGTEEPDLLLSKIRFLVAACGCKYVFFDNITLMGSGRTTENVTKELDWLSTRLVMLVKELRFVLIFISHENANEETKDCKNISKVADVWINLKRDTKNENEFLRRLLYPTVFKNRQNWKTGPAGRLVYDPETATLQEFSEELPT